MFRSGPLWEGVQKNGETFGLVHVSFWGMVCLGSHVSGALWPGVETSGLIAIKNCSCFFIAHGAAKCYLIGPWFTQRLLKERVCAHGAVAVCSRLTLARGEWPYFIVAHGASKCYLIVPGGTQRLIKERVCPSGSGRLVQVYLWYEATGLTS